MTSDPKILALAFLGGILPSLLWLWFWLKEDRDDPEPNGLLAIVFIMGIISVLCVLPIQKFIHEQVLGENLQTVLFASAEEIIKYIAILVLLFGTHFIDDPIDWPIYLITSALGFAALENMLFLVKPLSIGQTTVGLLTGQLRFLGSTLLHTVSSGTLGIALGLSFHMTRWKREFYLFAGLVVAIALHSVFNFFIIRNDGNDFLKVYGFLWVVTVVVMLLFEKLRRMN